MNLNFSEDKLLIAHEFTERDWMEDTGLAPDALKEKCRGVWEESKGQSVQLRRARVTACLLDHAQIEILPCEVFTDQLRIESIFSDVSRENNLEARKTIEEELKKTDAAHVARAFQGMSDFGHTCPDWRALLHLGFPGILNRLKAAREQAAEEQLEFFDSCIMVYEAILRALRRMANAAELRAAEHPRLHDMAENLRALADHAPETLYQALQLSYIYYFVQHDVEQAKLRSLGRFDLMYQPFYEADVAAGRLTRESAKELLQYYMYRWSARNVVANIPMTLCGRDEQGREVGSDFTRLLLEAYGELNVTSPKFQIRVTPGMREDILTDVLSLIRKGNSSFVFCNDDVVERALIRLGHTPEDARDYVMIGCYESGSMGRELPCTCSGYMSVPKAVEYALNGGVDRMTGEQYGLPTPPEYATFEEFEAAVHDQLRHLADQCMQRIRLFESIYPKVFSCSSMSATMEHCLEVGNDVYYGSAKYNYTSINPFGWGTAADAMAAVRYLVYEQKRVTLPELNEILQNNWAGQELLRRIVLKHAPKYGVDDPRADQLAEGLIRTVADHINNQPNGRGGCFRTGGFSIHLRYEYGKLTGASADGRLAGEPYSKNLSATLGMDTEGATGMIQSATCFDGTLLPNGTVLDLVLHESAVSGSDGMAAMLSLVRTYMKRGGIAIQFNVLSADTLRQAQAHPERYPTLQVRLCGWNVLFVNLSKEEQDELIRQAESA